MPDFSLLRASEGDLLYLNAEWRKLAAPYRAKAETTSRIFEFIATRYSHPARSYHNLHHVAELLRLLASFQEQIADYAAVSFAAWFHDVIYEAQRQDNEEKSAEVAAAMLGGLNAPAATIETARQLILATKTHRAEHLSADAALFLDADLSILGAPPEIYRQYSAAIRSEYAHVPEALYRQARKEILQGFLNRPQLYRTNEMRAIFETQARANIGQELRLL